MGTRVEVTQLNELVLKTLSVEILQSLDLEHFEIDLRILNLSVCAQVEWTDLLLWIPFTGN